MTKSHPEAWQEGRSSYGVPRRCSSGVLAALPDGKVMFSAGRSPGPARCGKGLYGSRARL